ncbi:MAG: tRNA (adenosine(37)-N6)-threonylcarbamoyltransferase complex dimerization subunit type 1 TsaB, partial [Eubacteriales bacterium]
MKILALDTTAKTATAAVLEDEKLLGIYTVNTENTHSETLLPMIKSLLSSLSLDVSSIDAFAVSIGPGSFTGVRIGVATVKGLAFGTGKKCIGVD